jgi:plasmid maintenance system killer protein
MIEQRLVSLHVGTISQSPCGKPVRYSVHVNGPWCITFEFEGGDATRVDFEQYH